MRHLGLKGEDLIVFGKWMGLAYVRSGWLRGLGFWVHSLSWLG